MLFLAAKTALGTFLFSKEATQLEKDLIKSLKVRDIVSPYAGKKKKQPTFRDATTGVTRQVILKKEGRNSILIPRHYPDLSTASDWLKICFIQSEAISKSR